MKLKMSTTSRRTMASGPNPINPEIAPEPISWAGMESPSIVRVLSKTDLVSYSNLFFKDTKKQSSSPSETTHRDPEKQSSNPSETAHRDPENGAWTFKGNTETDLLKHVENGLADHIKTFSDVESAEAILRSIDVYCLGKQWMFHVGHEKGDIIKPFLKKCIAARVAEPNDESPTSSQPPFVVVELGTYCGYSAILLAKTVREFAPDLDFHVFSTETDEKNLAVATRMIKMAKLDRYITLILLDPAVKSLSRSLERHIPGKKVDFLFLDHAKDLYLSDLRELEKSAFVEKGTHVVADNVVFSSELKSYREYVGSLAERSVVETRMVEGKLEYSDSSQDLKDGIELTVYLQDPPKKSR